LALTKYHPWSDSPWEVAPIRATGMFKYATSNDNQHCSVNNYSYVLLFFSISVWPASKN
jgi:hypothetical protein